MGVLEVQLYRTYILALFSVSSTAAPCLAYSISYSVFDIFCILSIPYLIYSTFYMFCVSYILYLKRFRSFFRCSDSLGLNLYFRFKSDLELAIIIRAKKENTRRSTMYIEKAAYHIFFLLDLIYNLTYWLIIFSLDFLIAIFIDSKR